MLYIPDSFPASDHYRTYPGYLRDLLPQLWPEYSGFIFALATGAVVRLIAPLLSDKQTDPAIAVIDPQGKFVISLCGGHQGGADQLSRLIAQQLQAIPVLTGAAQALQLPALDTLGDPFGWRRGAGDWTAVSAAIAAQKKVQVIQDSGSRLWQDHLPTVHPFGFAEETAEDQVWISARQAPTVEISQVQWHPRVLWLGIGCVRGTPQALIQQAVQTTIDDYNLAPQAIAGVASLDLKADEEGLLAYCTEHNLPFKTYPAQVLKPVPVPNPSPVVAEEVGTPSVAEASALMAAQAHGSASLIVSKQIFKQDDYAVTLAIAEASQEYIDKVGTLWLVGTGPGELAQITPAAQTALVNADAIIGYSLYLDLIQPLQRPGQIIESFPITQERQRCQRAIALAEWGLKVAVVSSGDCGIYGMAGLVLEELEKKGWDGQSPTVEVFPGITALQAAAAKVGAPLMHDFCAISLSDLLTPQAKILQRLTAAAQADFVTALYNPKSQKRTELIATAQRIFLECRSPQTPVALVRSVYREDESIVQTTLAEMLHHPIDMLTVVLIGNTTTYQYKHWLITPRGY